MSFSILLKSNCVVFPLNISAIIVANVPLPAPPIPIKKIKALYIFPDVNKYPITCLTPFISVSVFSFVSRSNVEYKYSSIYLGSAFGL